MRRDQMALALVDHFGLPPYSFGALLLPLLGQSHGALFLDFLNLHFLGGVELGFVGRLALAELHVLPGRHKLLLEVSQLGVHDLLELLYLADVDADLLVLEPVEHRQPKEA